MDYTRTPSLNSYQLNTEKQNSVFRMDAMYKKCSEFVAIFHDFITRALRHSVFISDSWPPETCNYITYLFLDEISFKI